jgi:hypothetical protein
MDPGIQTLLYAAYAGISTTKRKEFTPRSVFTTENTETTEMAKVKWRCGEKRDSKDGL